MPSIVTFITYVDKAEEAANLYVSLFPDSKIRQVTRYGEGAPGPSGSVMTVAFTLLGKEYVALNGGPHFKLTDAFSLSVMCDTQAEIDHYWEKLSEGGEPGPCGWLKDKFGMSWQVVPRILPELLEDPERGQRVMGAVMKMKKLDLEVLKKAHAGS